jgi:hypothetical protein
VSTIAFFFIKLQQLVRVANQNILGYAESPSSFSPENMNILRTRNPLFEAHRVTVHTLLVALFAVLMSACVSAQEAPGEITAELLLPDDGQNFASAFFIGSNSAQTFTATVPGVISTIELPVHREPAGMPTDPLVIELWDVDENGEPDYDAAVIARRVLQPEDLPTDVFTLELTSIDFLDAGVFMDTGDQLAIVASSLTDGFPHWYYWTARGIFGKDLFSGGSFYFDGATGMWFTNPGDDGGFRVRVLANAIFSDGFESSSPFR